MAEDRDRARRSADTVADASMAANARESFHIEMQDSFAMTRQEITFERVAEDAFTLGAATATARNGLGVGGVSEDS